MSAEATSGSSPAARLRPERVLIIEDDPAMSSEISACLSSSGFVTERCLDGSQGLALALSGRYDAITLDRMLPGQDGLQIAQAVRAAGLNTPILMLSGLSELDDRVSGLRAGGDDYLVKPFAPLELVVRIEVLLRRSNQTHRQELTLKLGDLQLDLIDRKAWRGVRFIDLLPMEFKLLEFLMRNAGLLLSRRMIFEHVWEYSFDPGTNLIDVHMGKLRKKLDEPGKPSFFRTERGLGYVFDAVS
jgi:two-component system OmpR family response regulator